MENKSGLFNMLINDIIRITKSSTNRNDKLFKISELLKKRVEYYDWVGFYIVDRSDTQLDLGPFVGEPTDHAKIQFGEGICGQAANTKKTFIVQDVSKETNYLSCSPEVKSEIVIPIIKNGEIKGELDIDSHTQAPFTDDDKIFLEKISNIILSLF
jgi:GAF domain-containing protein